MIAVDTNLLVYAHRTDSEWHVAAEATVRGLAEGLSPWAVPWPCLHEFLAIATHPRVFDPPSTQAQAVAQADAWLASPFLVLLAEGVDHWRRLTLLLKAGRIRGPMVHDARIAAICLDNGVSEFLTSDRDFSRFPDLRTRNPLVEEGRPRPSSR